MSFLLLSLSLARAEAPPVDGDVVASRVVAAPAAEVFAYATDLSRWGSAVPERCASDWRATGAPGPAQQVDVTWHLGLLHPQLHGSWEKFEAPRYADLDHPGKRGFVTRVKVEPLGDASARLTVHTFVEAPGFPIQKYYMGRIRPAWTQCWVEALDGIAAGVEAGS